MSENETQLYLRVFWGVGISAVIIFALSQPLWQYADPTDINRVGYLAALTLSASYAVVGLTNRWVTWPLTAITILFAITALIFINHIVTEAETASRTNDRRCLIIERELLRGKPRRDDLADLFQAFKCRPQSVLMPRRPAAPLTTAK